jgi:BolA protein
MLVKDEIHERLTAAFAPRELVVVDDSESHRGHAGYQEGGQSHFNVRMRAQAFENMKRVARHRAVHKALGVELVGRIHALALDLDV